MDICVPSTCTQDDVNNMAQFAAKYIDIEVTVPRCSVKESLHFDKTQVVIMGTMNIKLYTRDSENYIRLNSWSPKALVENQRLEELDYRNKTPFRKSCQNDLPLHRTLLLSICPRTTHPIPKNRIPCQESSPF
ncbi:hypothetical protein AVEN_170563-1 [Araneus ventricosus]|uniref:Uncharacterized protein n=1 Tax=Araneus ventricosus TaxID=182803 RepID=A0A4Y2UCS8_ARAVE|nr:hypothetical protein AVEN_170563-1 [Araneus ventricosus]